LATIAAKQKLLATSLSQIADLHYAVKPVRFEGCKAIIQAVCLLDQKAGVIICDLIATVVTK